MGDIQRLVDELQKCPDCEVRARLIQESAEFAVVDVARAICRASVSKLGSDQLVAKELCDDLCRLASRSHDPIVVAYRDHASACYISEFGSDPREAVNLWLQAIEAFEAAGLPGEAAISASSSLAALCRLGEFDLFQQLEAKARSHFLLTADRLRLARLRSNAAIAHVMRYEWTKAQREYELVLDDFLSIGTEKDIQGTLHDLCVCHLYTGDYGRADAILDKLRAERRRICVDPDLALAFLKYNQGDLDASLSLARQAQSCAQNNSSTVYLAFLTEADVLRALSLPQHGEAKAMQAAQGLEKLGLPLLAAEAFVTVGRCAQARRRFGVALTYFATARATFERYRSVLGLKVCALEEARVHFSLGETQRAYSVLQDLLAGDEPLPIATQLECQLLLSTAQKERGELESAVRTAEQAHSRATLKGLGRLELEALEVLGQLHESVGLAEEALSIYSRADETTARVRTSLSTTEMKAAYFGTKTSIYEGHFSLAVALKRPVYELFRIAESSKSRSLADRLASQELLRTTGSPAPHNAGLIHACDAIRQSLRDVDEATTANSGFVSTLEQVKRSLITAEHEICRILRHPESPGHRRDLYRPSALSLMNSLSSDTAVVEYFQARGVIYAFVLTRSELRHVEIGRAKEIDSLVQLAVFNLRKSTLPKRQGKGPSLAISHYMQELYDHLWSPVARYIPTARVVVVPHGMLHYLPFHALEDGDSHLIDRHTISYAPSASILYMTRMRSSTSSPRSVVVVGAADGRAPAIAREAQEVAEIYEGSCLLLNAEATKERLGVELPDARILHIASHGWFNQRTPSESGVAVGDGILSAQDLQRMELVADLVVLSGCDTGRAVVSGCDELAGLSQALLQAGARSTLVSLWSVNDEATAIFMRQFHSRIKQGRSPDASFRDAARALRESVPHPSDWAPFVLIGDATTDGTPLDGDA